MPRATALGLRNAIAMLVARLVSRQSSHSRCLVRKNAALRDPARIGRVAWASTFADKPGYQFSFGAIADIQYADVDSGSNFKKSVPRNFRRGLCALKRAIDTWNADSSQLNFVTVMQLGDLIDGQNSGTYGAGLDFDKPQSEQSWQLASKIISDCSASTDWHHLIGNHELYNFAHHDMPDRLNYSNTKIDDKPNHGHYYSFSPAPGWRFVILDSYVLSTLGRPSDDPSAQVAVRFFVIPSAFVFD